MPSQHFIERFLRFLTAFCKTAHLQQGACSRLPKLSASAVQHELLEAMAWPCPLLELPSSSAQKQEGLLEEAVLTWRNPHRWSALLDGGAQGNTAYLATQFVWLITTKQEETKELVEPVKQEQRCESDLLSRYPLDTC